MPRVDYSARTLHPVYLERDRSNPLELGMYRDGALVAPTSGTISVYNASNVAVVSAAAVAIASSKATYTVTTGQLSGQSYGDRWRVEWTLAMPDGVPHLVREDAVLVRVRLHPVVTDADLLRRHADLSTHNGGTLQDQVDEAWTELVNRLEARGRRPYLVLSPSALRPAHLYLSLAIACRNLGMTGDAADKWAQLAETYQGMFERAWDTITFVYDEADEGKATSSRRRAAQSTIWLAGRA